MFKYMTNTAKFMNKFYSTSTLRKTATIYNYDYDYQYDCYENLNIHSDQYKYIGDIKHLKHFIDSTYNMYAFHPNENFYEHVATWDDVNKIPITKNKQIYIPIFRNRSKKYFYDVDFLDTYTFSNCFNRVLYVGTYDKTNDKIISHYI